MSKNIVEKIMYQEFRNRSFKYRLFFSGILLEKFIFQYDRIDHFKRRGLLLRNYYFLMRYLDDIIDGDIQIKDYTLINDRIQYLEEKLNNIVYGIMPKDDVDYMIYECHELANQIGFSMVVESKSIIKSLIFDGKRISQWENEQEFKIVTKKELEQHFYDLDIIGTISGCLKIFKEDKSYLDDLYYLGTASRIYYDLRDFVDDIKKGLVNISVEDILKYNISDADIYKVLVLSDKFIEVCKKKSFASHEIITEIPESIVSFLFDRSKSCKELLTTYYNRMEDMRENPLRNSTKLTLSLGYEKPIEKHLSLIR